MNNEYAVIGKMLFCQLNMRCFARYLRFTMFSVGDLIRI